MKTTNQIAVLAALLALTGCNPGDSSDGSKPPESPGSTGAVLQLPKSSPGIVLARERTPDPPPLPSENRDAFIVTMEQKLKDFDAKIAELAKEAEGYKDDAKTQADQALVALREEREKLNTQFDSLKQSGAEAWKELKAGMEAAYAELEKAFENAKLKFK